VVPLEQHQFRLVRAVFETRRSWPDNTFYDVSTWTLPLTFDVPYRAVQRESWSEDVLGAEVEAMPAQEGALQTLEAPVAWAFEWHHAAAAPALARLLEAGVRARVATKRFTARTAGEDHAFDYGTVVVPRGIQDVTPETLSRRKVMRRGPTTVQYCPPPTAKR